jgi:hypothetical protein
LSKMVSVAFFRPGEVGVKNTEKRQSFLGGTTGTFRMQVVEVPN